MTAPASITVDVNGNAFAGWLQSTVERSIEEIAGRFSIPVGFLPDASRPPIERQDDVVVKIGGVTVITGIVLAAEPFYSRGDYGIRVEGRDRTGDLVAAAAMYKGGQWRNATLEQIAKDLCAPFGIEVRADVDTGKPFERFELENGESVADALSRGAKYRAVLVTRDDEGRLLLTRAGTAKAPAALVTGTGGNVLEMEGRGTDAERGSEYVVQGQNEIAEKGPGGAHDIEARAKDPGIKRYLPIVIPADEGGAEQDLQLLADHTARVRMARAFSYRYQIDGWEANGRPWTPNTLVPIYDPILGLDGDEWLIVSASATVSRDNADVTELVVCPPAAYELMPLPEPQAPTSKESGRSGGTKAGTPVGAAQRWPGYKGQPAGGVTGGWKKP